MTNHTNVDILAALGSTYLFEVVPPAGLEALLPFAIPRRYARGEYVYRVGDASDHLPVVAEGTLKHHLPTEDGGEFVLEIVSAGGVCGEPGLFAREANRIADLIALEPSVVINIEKQALVDFLIRHPLAMLRMLEGLAEQVRSAAEDLGAVAFQDIRGRLALKLVELVVTDGRPTDGGIRMMAPLSQTTLAGMIGASRENVNRALRALSVAGYVRVTGRTIVVTDVGALRGLSGGGHRATYRRNIRS